MTDLSSITVPLVARAMDASALRHQAIALNVANASIPGAPRWQVVFEALLNRVGSPEAVPGTTVAQSLPMPEVVRAQGPVKLDQEMGELAVNAAHYQALARALTRHLSILSMAAQEARR